MFKVSKKCLVNSAVLWTSMSKNTLEDSDDNTNIVLSDKDSQPLLDCWTVHKVGIPLSLVMDAGIPIFDDCDDFNVKLGKLEPSPDHPLRALFSFPDKIDMATTGTLLVCPDQASLEIAATKLWNNLDPFCSAASFTKILVQVARNCVDPAVAGDITRSIAAFNMLFPDRKIKSNTGDALYAAISSICEKVRKGQTIEPNMDLKLRNSITRLTYSLRGGEHIPVVLEDQLLRTFIPIHVSLTENAAPSKCYIPRINTAHKIMATKHVARLEALSRPLVSLRVISGPKNEPALLIGSPLPETIRDVMEVMEKNEIRYTRAGSNVEDILVVRKSNFVSRELFKLAPESSHSYDEECEVPKRGGVAVHLPHIRSGFNTLYVTTQLLGSKLTGPTDAGISSVLGLKPSKKATKSRRKEVVSTFLEISNKVTPIITGLLARYFREGISLLITHDKGEEARQTSDRILTTIPESVGIAEAANDSTSFTNVRSVRNMSAEQVKTLIALDNRVPYHVARAVDIELTLFRDTGWKYLVDVGAKEGSLLLKRTNELKEINPNADPELPTSPLLHIVGQLACYMLNKNLLTYPTPNIHNGEYLSYNSVYAFRSRATTMYIDENIGEVDIPFAGQLARNLLILHLTTREYGENVRWWDEPNNKFDPASVVARLLENAPNGPIGQVTSVIVPEIALLKEDDEYARQIEGIGDYFSRPTRVPAERKLESEATK